MMMRLLQSVYHEYSCYVYILPMLAYAGSLEMWAGYCSMEACDSVFPHREECTALSMVPEYSSV